MATMDESKAQRTMTLVSLQMPNDLRDRMKRLAAASERTFSAEVRHALRTHLDRTAAKKTTTSP
jgi:predicted transcriptional regulator